MKIIVPMAGDGSRFKKVGYTIPKPFIDVKGKPMILRAIERFTGFGDFIFICKEEHKEFTKDLPGSKFYIREKTEGAACTVLLAKPFVKKNEPILIINSDQIIDMNYFNFKTFLGCCSNSLDGIICTFEELNRHPKWSYVQIDENHLITRAIEKEPISNFATVGAYYWKSFDFYKACADQMIGKNRRVNGEFYVCPVYQEAIEFGSLIAPYMVDRMIGLGTPEDLNKYLCE